MRHIATEKHHILFHVVSLHRGPLRASQFPLAVPITNARACLSPLRHTPPSPDWLLLAGQPRLFHANDTAASILHAKFGPFSLLDPVRLPGVSCGSGKLHNIRRMGDNSDRMIWMTPWKHLSKEVVSSIIDDAGEMDMWWRANRAWVEFGDHVHRAVEASAGLAGGSNPNSSQVHVEQGEWWLSSGVSFIAACKDRPHTLASALPSWLAVRGIDEIVLVDWSSQPAISQSLPSTLLNHSAITLVTVSGQTDWILSRAYNLAARFATFSRIVKVDCDTVLSPDFLEAHLLQRGMFYAGDWRQLHSGISNKLHANGLLYVHRDDFLGLGGYDERITTYGWDDSDISERLSRIRSFQPIAYNKITHIPHSASLRVINQNHRSLLSPGNPHAAAVEIQRNRLLLSRFNLPKWRATSLHTLWNVLCIRHSNMRERSEQEVSPHVGPGDIFHVSAANHISSAAALVSDMDALDVAKRAIRLILHRYGVQLLPKTLSLQFYKTLMDKIAFPTHYAEVVLILRGGCISRLLAHIASKQATARSGTNNSSVSTDIRAFVTPPSPYIDWRLQELWQFPDAECACGFSRIFEAIHDEVISTWFDRANPLPSRPSVRMRQPSVNISKILNSFNTHSREKNSSEQVAKWIDASRNKSSDDATPRILFNDIACDINPSNVPSWRQELIRAGLRHIEPVKALVDTIERSLAKQEPSALDSPLLLSQYWSSYVGEDQAMQMKHMFESVPIIEMCKKWSSTSSPLSKVNYSLEQRAASLYLSLHLLQQDNISKEFSNSSLLPNLPDIMVPISKRVERLFLGCETPAYNYVSAYPELLVIVAGLISSDSCITPS